MNSLKIGYFSPLPPAASGVADYAAALLTELQKTGTVEIASEHFEKNMFDLPIYHLGNNPLHAKIYARALIQPGVVVLHDAVLTHFLLGELSQEEWINEFVYNYGEWMRGFGRDLWMGRSQSGSDPRYFTYPMLKRICERAHAVIVHNPAAATAVLRHAPAANVVEIPHFCDPHFCETHVSQAVSTGPLRAGVFGYLRESKRLAVILRAVERARGGGANVELLMAGSFASPDLERALHSQLAQAHIEYTGHLDEARFLNAARSVDVCINLRHPSANETSGIGVRLMGLGKAVIFTDGPELARLPELACLRVKHDGLEEEMLAEYLVELTANREMAYAIGERAARHIAQDHSLPKVAAQYWQVLQDSASAQAGT